MEGYTENGAGTDVTDQIGFAGMRRKKKQRRGLSVFQLKVIGAVALVLSAGSTTLVPLIFGSDTSNMTSLTAMVLCEVVSWFAAPIYAWLLVQGFQQTRNRVAYGVQLLLLALIAEVPYDLATSGKPFDFGSQNPVFGLFIAFAMLRSNEMGGAALPRCHARDLRHCAGSGCRIVGSAVACRTAPASDEPGCGDAWFRADFLADALA